ncbi:hypothetical protein EDC01DRAFT_787966 [Geopyxis carbonaria]|nr:hypothetical protein EDC01DRAFT_787966 [Geopyxis carbonaria]
MADHRYSIFPKPSTNRTLSVYTTDSVDSRSPSTISTPVPGLQPTRPRSATTTHSIASTLGGITLGGEPQSVQDHQELQWPLQSWHGTLGPSARAPYESYIEFLSQKWPHLGELREWMAGLDSSPRRHKARLHKLGTTVLDFREAAAPIRREFPDDTGARDSGSGFNHLSICLQRSTPATVKGRMIVVPYLVPSLVNVLGSTFDIDPEFFHGHLGLSPDPHPLPSDPFIRINYHVDVPGVPGTTEERCFSVFIHIPTEKDRHWTSIILLTTPDSITSSTPSVNSWPSGRNPLPRPQFSKGPTPTQDLFHTYIQTILDQPPSCYKYWATDPFFGLAPLFSHTVRQWSVTLAALCTRLNSHPSKIDPLPALRHLYTTLTSHESTLTAQLEIVNAGGRPEWKSRKLTPRSRCTPPVLAAIALEHDYARVLRIARDLRAATDDVERRLEHAQLERDALAVQQQQARDVRTLLRIVGVLIPLMLVVQLFGMNIDGLKMVYKPFVFVAVVLAVAVLCGSIAVARPVREWVSRRRRRDRRKDLCGVGVSSADYAIDDIELGRVPVPASTRTSRTAGTTGSVTSWETGFTKVL